METIAVYWEPKVRVYGLTTVTGLSLFSLFLPTEKLSHWGRVVEGLEGQGGKFELVNIQTASPTTMQLCLIPTLDNHGPDVRRELEEHLDNAEISSLKVTAPVELIYLHGPHFQDRYGIAEAALTPLKKVKISVLAAGCAGTSVYIVVAENRAREAAVCLSETFVL